MTIPLVRAGSLAPLVKWMEQRGRPVDTALAAAGVTCDPVSNPDNLVPMRAVLAMMRDVAEREDCPDLGWRVVVESSISDMGLFGRLALSEATPAGVLRRASGLIENFCSHEVLKLSETPGGGGTVLVRFLIPIDPAALHQVQLFSLALIHSLCPPMGPPARSFFDRVRIPPHPVFGLSHLPAALAGITIPSADDALVMMIGRGLLHSPFKTRPPASPPPVRTGDWVRLRGDEVGLTKVLRALISEALVTGPPSAEVMARNAGVTLRTLQRRLAKDGTSFRELVDQARRALALQQISDGSSPIGTVSDSLGYSSPASLSRAVRRWTDRTPRALRRGEEPAASE